MAVNIAQLVAETKKSRYSLIPHLSENDVHSVWDGVSEFIEKLMLQQKGVCIHSFGTFTFSQRKLELGGSKSVTVQRPVFVLSEKMVQTHGLTHQKLHLSGTIPVLPLNYTVVANSTPWERGMVETCVRELLLCLSRLLAMGKTVELDFTGVGRLLLREKKVKMKFFKEFIRSLDNSGSIETNFFGQYSRSGTSDSSSSIMTGPNRSSGALVLPKIVEASPEEETNGTAAGLTLANTEHHPPTSNSPPHSTNPLDGGQQESKSLNRGQHQLPSSAKLTGLGPVVEGHKRQSTAPQSSASLRKSLPHSLTNSSSALPAVADSRPKTTCSHHAQSAGQDLCYLCHQRNQRNKPVMVDEERRAQEEMEDRLMYEYLCMKDKHSIAFEKTRMASNRQVEKEMAQFNLEAFTKRKLQRKYEGLHYTAYHPSYMFQHRPLTPPPLEKQEEYRSQLDSQVTFKQSKLKKTTDEEKQADLMDHKKLVKELAVLDEKFHKAKAAKKLEYQLALDDQRQLNQELRRMTNLHQCKNKSLHQKRSLSGYPTSSSACSDHCCMLPKSILAEIVTGCRPSHGTTLNSKKKETKEISFDTQPVFGVQDTSADEKLKEQHERALAFCKEHLAAMDKKQKLKKDKEMKMKEHDAEILMKTRKELLQEIATARRDKWLARSSLEKEWLENIKQKEVNIVKESQQTNTPSILLHDQCRKYHRCRQCQRRRNNYGHSNILSESRFIAGSRLMV